VAVPKALADDAKRRFRWPMAPGSNLSGETAFCR